MSCKDQNGGGGQQVGTKEFEVSELKFWGRNILAKDKITLDGNDSPKSLVVTVGNCEEYDVTVSMKGKIGTGKGAAGYAEVKFEDIETDSVLVIKLSASGMKTYTQNVNVKISEAVASDLVVYFGTQQMVQGGAYNTTESTAKVKLTSTTSKMTKVSVDGTAATLAEDGKTATYDLTITGTEDNPQNVSVEVEFKYHNKATLTYVAKKYATQQDLPIELVSAKILSGDDGAHKQDLKFDADKKATVSVEDARYSTVKLVMEFDKDLQTATVKNHTNQRNDQYTKNFLTEYALSGTFSGYITHDVNFQTGEETALPRISGKTYTEVLIVGYGTVSYEIEVESKSNKKATYTVEISNPTEVITQGGQDLNTEHFMKNTFRVYNGHMGWGTFYNFSKQLNGFFLPFYYKGPNWTTDGKSNEKGFVEPAYMEDVSLVIVDKAATDKFCFYYNVMGDDSGKPKNEGKFKRITALKGQGGGYLLWTNIKDVHDKYFDCFMSGKETLPNPMMTYLYDKKWKKTSNKHGFLLELENTQKSHWESEEFPSGSAFAWIFNYRVQAMSYDEQNKAGGENKYLTIAKNQDFAYWETGAKEGGDTNGWAPFLSGKEGDEKDVFKFFPLCKVEDVKEVRCTIKKGNDEASCVPETDYENVLLSAVNENNETFYRLGCKANETTPSYTFKEGVYKVEIEVTYKDNEAQKDKFRYILDYTNNQHKIELMNLVGEEDVNTNLFGVPTSYSSTRMPEFDIMKKRTTQDFLKMKTYR